MSEPDDGPQGQVQRTDHGVSITTKLTRGTNTRDQDKHVIKSKGATFDEARYYHDQALDYAEAELLDRVRAWQPGADEDE